VESEKLRRALTIRCRFSNHVFTRAFDPQVDPTDPPIIMDGIRQRVFCPNRYRLSVHLPGAIVSSREPRVYVRETKARRNWLYVATIEVPSGATDPLKNGAAQPILPGFATRCSSCCGKRKKAGRRQWMWRCS
jgi:hypothetical protein